MIAYFQEKKQRRQLQLLEILIKEKKDGST